jgi:hypothetical protein
MTGPTGPVSGPRRPDDIDSSARRSGAFGGSAGVSQSAATPTGVKGHFGTPARLVTLRVSVVGSSLASPSGLRVLVHPLSAP